MYSAAKSAYTTNVPESYQVVTLYENFISKQEQLMYSSWISVPMTENLYSHFSFQCLFFNNTIFTFNIFT